MCIDACRYVYIDMCIDAHLDRIAVAVPDVHDDLIRIVE